MRNPLSKVITEIEPSGIRKFFDIVSEMKDAISLGVGEPDFDTPWHIRDEGIYSLEKGRTFYTSNAGLKELKEEISAYLQKKLTVYTDHTISDPVQLKAELEATRQRGYAIDDMEHEFGVKCVAMPIFDKTHKLYAAISVSGLAVHFTDRQIQEWALLIKKYVAKIENRLS